MDVNDVRFPRSGFCRRCRSWQRADFQRQDLHGRNTSTTFYVCCDCGELIYCERRTEARKETENEKNN